MITTSLEIVNKLGLHARAASAFVKLAGSFSAEITVRNPHNPGKEANGKSIMAMMMLEAALGSQIEIAADGEDESEAIAALSDLVNNRFGEAE